MAQDDKHVFEEASQLFKISLDSIVTLDCHYTYRNDHYRREVHYIRDGDKRYMGSIGKSDDGNIMMPDEVAWDDRTVTHRARVNMLVRSSSEERYQQSAPTPYDTAFAHISDALGYKRHDDEKYQLLSAKWGSLDGDRVVDLQFNTLAGRRAGAVLSIRLSARYNYLPVEETCAKGNVKLYELKRIEYFHEEVDGNSLFFPKVAEFVYYTSHGASQISSTVDSVVLNRSVPAASFILTPFPSDEILDFESAKTFPAKEPSADPAQVAGFPFKEFLLATSAPRGVAADADKSRAPAIPAAIKSEDRRFWLSSGFVLSGMAIGSWLIYRSWRG